MQRGLLTAAVAAGLSLVATAQLQPQVLPPSPPDTTSCFDASSLIWRSIPGKVVLEGQAPKPIKPKPIKPVPVPLPAAAPAAPVVHLPDPDEEAEAVAVVGARGGVAGVAARDKQEVTDGAAAAEAQPLEDGEDKARVPLPPPTPAQIQIKALNWFGLDRINIFEGTNYKTIDEVIDFFEEHKINAIRLPFSLAFALSPMDKDDTHALGELQYPDRDKISPEYYELTSWEIVDLLFDKCAERGILILLDMHTLDPDKGISRLWYDPEEYSEGTVLWGWERITLRYANHWNLFGVDIMNECHDHASWGKGDPLTDFNQYVQRFILFISERVPDYKGLFFVEGIFINGYGKTPSQYPYWWGGNLFGAEKYPIDVKDPELNDRVVYAPHIYGPDVSNMPYFSAWNFPYNLDSIWDEQYGWLIKTLGKAVVVGEWGGSCNGKDGTVQEHLAQWMVDNCLTSNFWWALNPGSADTDGLMSPDWTHYDERKMRILDYVQPDPSSFKFDPKTNTVCVRHGEARNKDCRNDPANLKKNQRWSYFDEKDLSAALDNSYQNMEKRLRGSAAGQVAA